MARPCPPPAAPLGQHPESFLVNLLSSPSCPPRSPSPKPTAHDAQTQASPQLREKLFIKDVSGAQTPIQSSGSSPLFCASPSPCPVLGICVGSVLTSCQSGAVQCLLLGLGSPLGQLQLPELSPPASLQLPSLAWGSGPHPWAPLSETHLGTKLFCTELFSTPPDPDPDPVSLP